MLLLTAIKAKNSQEALRLLRDESNHNLDPLQRMEVLKCATENKLIEVIQALFKINIIRTDIDVIDLVLCWSAFENQILVLERILSCEVIKSRISMVYNALKLAAAQGNQASVARLLKYLARIEEKMRRTALYPYNLSKQSDQLLRFIVLHFGQDWKNAALLNAIKNCHNAVVNEMLKDKFVQFGVVLKNHQALKASAKSGNLVIFRLLIEVYQNEEWEIPSGLYYMSNKIPTDLTTFWPQIKSINALIQRIFSNIPNHTAKTRPADLILEYASIPNMDKSPSIMTVDDILKENAFIQKMAFETEKDLQMIEMIMNKPIFSKGEIYDVEKMGLLDIHKHVIGLAEEAAACVKRAQQEVEDHQACRELEKDMRFNRENLLLWRKQIFTHGLNFLFLQIQELAADQRVLEESLKNHIREDAEIATALGYFVNKVQGIRLEAEFILNELEDNDRFIACLSQMEVQYEALYGYLVRTKDIAILLLKTSDKEYLNDSSRRVFRVILKVECLQFERIKIKIFEEMQNLKLNLQYFSQIKTQNIDRVKASVANAKLIWMSTKDKLGAADSVSVKVNHLIGDLKTGKNIKTERFIKVGQMLTKTQEDLIFLQKVLMETNQILKALPRKPLEFQRYSQSRERSAETVAITSTKESRKCL